METGMILTADLHLRMTRPRCRKDDYQAAQERKLRFILEWAVKSPPLLVAGDFFHVAKPGEELLVWVMNILTNYEVDVFVIPGQHDLPGHNLDQLHRSGLGVLSAAGSIDLMALQDNFRQWNIHSIYGYPYGTYPNISGSLGTHPDGSRVALWHHMVINEVPIWPGQEADKAHLILKKYPQFDLIVTGDNHEPFCIATTDSPKRRGANLHYRWIVNPGSMMRMTAAQLEHKPCVYEWGGGVVKQHFLPIEEDVFDLTELEQSKSKDLRIQAFVEQLSNQWEIGLSFEKNMKKFFDENPEINDDTKRLIWECME